jgi:colanic acid biosynthesis protein WcaH
MEIKLIPQALYNEILRNLPIVCVDIFIYFEGKYLLVRRKNEPCKGNLWFAGGRLHKHEKLEDAAVRIAKNEVGLDCEVRRFMGVHETDFPTGPNNIPVHTINLTYFLVAKNDKVKLDHDHSEYMWVSQSNTPQELDAKLKEFVELVFTDEI